MARWAEDPRGRLLRSAVALFAEQGYDATTAAQIAHHAGLTKTTLFRHFVDKREIVFQGQEEHIRLAVGGIESVPTGTSAFDAMSAGVLAMCGLQLPETREFARRLDVIIANSAELQERAGYKRSAITESVRAALVGRGEQPRTAGVLADVGARAFYDGYHTWVSSSRHPFAATVRAELAAYRAVLHTAA